MLCATVVEAPVTADGDNTIADVSYFDPLSRERAILEVLVFTVESDTLLARTSRAEMDNVMAPLWAPEQEKRGHRVIQKITNGALSPLTPLVGCKALVEQKTLASLLISVRAEKIRTDIKKRAEP